MKSKDKMNNYNINNITEISDITNLSNLFRVIGDYTRLKILYSILDKELCVCEISEKVGMNQSAVSHQLKVLKKNRLVKFNRSGKHIYYSLDDEHIQSIFEFGLMHVKEENDLNV